MELEKKVVYNLLSEKYKEREALYLQLENVNYQIKLLEGRQMEFKEMICYDNMFSRDIVQRCLIKTNQQFKIENVIKDNFKRYIGVNLAIGCKEANDYTVIFVIAVNPETGVKIPIEIRRGIWNMEQSARYLIDASKRHNPRLIFVENNVYRNSLLQWVNELGEKSLPIEGFMTGKQNIDKFIGFSSMAVEFANNGWVIYNHQNPFMEESEFCKCSFCTFINELVNFPMVKHDDTIMAAWFAREACKKDIKVTFGI